MWMRRLTASITAPFRSPIGHVLLLLAYYLAIVVGLVLLYGKGSLTPTDFIYQGF